MYTIQVVTPPAEEPVSAAELRTWLRTNTTAEDPIMLDCIATARSFFETITGRPVLSTTYRQWFYVFESPIYLIRGGVTSVSSVKFYDPDGTLQTVSTDDYVTDLTNLVPSVTMTDGPPATSETKTPTGYVEFVAGWATVSAVPRDIKVAIRLLASSYFEHRAEYGEEDLKVLPMGFRAVADMYRTGLLTHGVTDAATG